MHYQAAASAELLPVGRGNQEARVATNVGQAGERWVGHWGRPMSSLQYLAVKRGTCSLMMLSGGL